jgi:hypothetical protein
MKIDDEYKNQVVFRSRLVVLKHLLLNQEEPSYVLEHYVDKHELSEEQFREIQSLVNKDRDELTKLLNKNIKDFIAGRYLSKTTNSELIRYSYKYQKDNFINKITDYVKHYGLRIPLHFEVDASLFGESTNKITFFETLIALEFEELISIVSLGEGVSKPHEIISENVGVWSLTKDSVRGDSIVYPVPIATIQLTRKLISLIEPQLSYLPHKLSFKSKLIFIPEGDQDMLCRVILRNKNTLKKEWSWDEVIEKWGGNYEGSETWRKVYNAGREVNKKVAVETGVKDLFDVKKKTISVNAKYLPFFQNK